MFRGWPMPWPGFSIIPRRHARWANVDAPRWLRTTSATSSSCTRSFTTKRSAEFQVKHPARFECRPMVAHTTFYRRFGKRTLDVVLSAAALLALSPLLLVIALAVRLFLGAPVLFRQRRTGKQRHSFTILKFRTMTDARDPHGELLSDSER